MQQLRVGAASLLTGLRFVDARVMAAEGEWPRGWIATSGPRIAAMGEGSPPPGDGVLTFDAEGLTIVPGFVDVHAHGGVGVDVMDADPEGLRRVARFYAEHGVSGWLPTTWTGSRAATLRALEAVASVLGPVPGGATILGAHMEGPYLNAVRPGAQDQSLIRPTDPEEAASFLDTGVVRLLTVAPEIPANRWLVEECRRRGITVSAGHTDASYDDAVQAVAAGVRHVTHTFNAMGTFRHRAPGMIGAALTLPQLRCEVIADNIHVHPAALRLLLRAKGGDGVVLVTDAVRATGLPDGDYDLGERAAVRAGGAIRLANGALAGSILTLDQGLRNLQRATGLPLARLWPATSLNAARSIGLDGDRGSLDTGKRADLALLDEDLRVVATVVEGAIVYGADRLRPAAARDGHAPTARKAAGRSRAGGLAQARPAAPHQRPAGPSTHWEVE